MWTTLSQMVWTDVSFGTFRELAEGHEKAGEKTCLYNPLIAEQIYVAGKCSQFGA